MKTKYALSIIAAIFSASLMLNAQTLPAGFRMMDVAKLSNPTAIAFAPDGRVFAAEKSGNIKVVRNGTAHLFAQLQIDKDAERGISGIALDPDFARNNYVYVFYNTANRKSRVSRFTAKGDAMHKGSEKMLVEVDGSTVGLGGELSFGADGKLYISIPDDPKQSVAQDVNNLKGKILRINSDGTAPEDNPYKTSDNAKLVWASGLANPFTFDIQPGTGRVYVNDEGKNDLEINDASIAGRNFGWPNVTGYGEDGKFTAPSHAVENNIAANKAHERARGATFFFPQSTNYPEKFRDKYYFIDHASGSVNFLDPERPSIRYSFSPGREAFCRSIETGPDGNLYILTENSIQKIIYTGDLTVDQATEPELLKQLKK